MKKALVAYFSASGQTARLAQTVAQAVGGDLFEIVPVQPYTKADLNWQDRKSRSTIEMNDESARPAIADRVANMDDYDVVFVGFPIWWYVAPRIVNTFLESYDFAGKIVIPFATSGGSGMGSTDAKLRAVCPNATFKPGKKLGSRESESNVAKWIDSLGL